MQNMNLLHGFFTIFTWKQFVDKVGLSNEK